MSRQERRDAPTSESGRQGPRMYTRDEAVKLGRRSLCEASGGGHQIERILYQVDSTGRPVVERYGCTVCDVKVRLEYPPLGR